MRVAQVVLGLGFFSLAAAAVAIGGCSSSDSSSSSSATSGGSTGSGATCAPTGACAAVNSDCLGLEDNSAKKDQIGLRVSQLTVAKPDALKAGAVKLIVDKGVYENLSDCNVNGNGTFSWLLEFDRTNNKLKTGGAKPVTDPHAGYCFVNQTIEGFDVASATLDATVGADGKFSVTMGQDLIVPIFLDPQATSQVLLPLHNLVMTGATLSADNNCIGKYNGAEFSTSNSCLPDATEGQKFFTDDAQLDAYITIEEADNVIVPQTQQSLCVLFSGDAGKFGDGGKPNKCKRDANMKTLAQGDWCSTTNKPADANCADAYQLSAAFAASSVKISGDCAK